MENIAAVCTTVVGRILLALVVFFVGRWIIKKIVGLAGKAGRLQKTDPTVTKFAVNALKWVLYVVLVMAIVGILGIPMASIATVIGAAGAAIALGLQGSLANLAGGVMLMIFKPFKVGDYIESGGTAGIVKEINLFYTVLNTLDNCRVNVPNGALMNATVTDYSAEETRRVDLTFTLAKSEDPQKIIALMQEVMAVHEKILSEPAPFARVSGGTNEGTVYTVRAWCETADYWNVYFDLIESCSKSLRDNKIEDPEERIAIRMVNEAE